MPTMNELESARDMALEHVERAKRAVERVERRYAASTLWFKVGVASSVVTVLCGLLMTWSFILVGVTMLVLSVMTRDINMRDGGIDVERARAQRQVAYDAFIDACQAVEDRRTLQLMNPTEYDRLEAEDERKEHALQQLRCLKADARMREQQAFARAFADANAQDRHKLARMFVTRSIERPYEN